MKSTRSGTPSSSSPRRRGRRPAPDDERKDRVIQARVPEDLEHTLKQAAGDIAGHDLNMWLTLKSAASTRIGNAWSRLDGGFRTARVCTRMEEAWSYASKGELVPLDTRIRHFATNQFTGGECFDAGHMIFKKTSTRGVWLNCPLQRQLRDLLVGANHITQNPDNLGDLLGGQLLGNPLPKVNPFGVKA